MRKFEVQNQGQGDAEEVYARSPEDAVLRIAERAGYGDKKSLEVNQAGSTYVVSDSEGNLGDYWVWEV